MIDPQTEKLLSLQQASQWLPHVKRKGGFHVATLYRWADRGLTGIQLETIQVGGTLCTSKEALQRFFHALTKAKGRCATGGGR